MGGIRDTVLHAAARGGHLAVCELLMQLETRIARIRDCEGETPVFRACEEGHTSVVSRMLDLYPDFIRRRSALDLDAFTLLHAASHSGNLSLFQMLLERDPGLLYLTNSDQASVLFAACGTGNMPLVQYLLRIESELIDVVSVYGSTSLHIATRLGEKSIPIFDLIRNLRPDYFNAISHYNDQQWSPFFEACNSSYSPMVVHMLDINPNVIYTSSQTYFTPLHFAADRGNESVASLLLRTQVTPSGVCG